MIKGNESDVVDNVFEILAKKEVKCFDFVLFSVLINCSELCNQTSNSYEFASKCSIFKLPEGGVKYSKLKIFDMRLVPLDHVTFMKQTFTIGGEKLPLIGA